MSDYAASRERRDASLAEHGFGTPRMLGGFLGGEYTVCQKCGAMVALNDLEELVEGMWTERGIRLHTIWHAMAGR